MTRIRTINGLYMKDEKDKIGFKNAKITLRTTSDSAGESLSLACESENVLLIIPLEGVRDMVRLTHRSK